MSEPALDILGIGTLAVDDLLYVAGYPAADQKAQVLREGRSFGGLIGTALAAAARLGARCAYAGMLGGDPLSKAVRSGLEQAGIDCGHVADSPDGGPVHSVIVVDENAGTRNIFFNLGPLRPYPADRIRRLLGTARVLLIDQLGTAEKLAALSDARQKGVPVVADMEWSAYEQVDALMAAVDHLILPQHFALEVTGERGAVAALERLHRAHPRVLTAVTSGRDGCYFLAGDVTEVRHQPAFEVPCVETTGCGDVFHGAYAVALSGGAGAAECVRFASAAAAVYASRPSGWGHLATRADVAALSG